MSQVILLNGISSSGKTSIAKAIQHLAKVPFLHIGVDTLIEMMPARYLSFASKSREGCYFEEHYNEYGKMIICNTGGEFGEKVFRMGVEIIKTIVNSDLNLIIDEVVWDINRMNDYKRVLLNHKALFVKVFCSRNFAQEREILRGNRTIGLANGQFDILNSMQWEYDIEINTEQISSFKSAEKILSFL